MFERVYRWMMEAAAGPGALWVLAGASFAESACLPIPIEAVSIPLMLADRRRVWLVAAVATAASVLGGLAGYFIGMFLYETVGAWLVGLYGFQNQMAFFQQKLAQNGIAFVAVGGLTPIPYKVISIVSGLGAVPLGLFMAVSLVSRALRFFGISTLFWWFGPSVRRFIETHGRLVGWSMFLIIIAGFSALYIWA